MSRCRATIFDHNEPADPSLVGDDRARCVLSEGHDGLPEDQVTYDMFHRAIGFHPMRPGYEDNLNVIWSGYPTMVRSAQEGETAD